MGWVIEHKRGKFTVREDDKPHDRMVVCDSRVDAEIVKGALEFADGRISIFCGIRETALDQIRKRAVRLADAWWREKHEKSNS